MINSIINVIVRLLFAILSLFVLNHNSLKGLSLSDYVITILAMWVINPFVEYIVSLITNGIQSRRNNIKS